MKTYISLVKHKVHWLHLASMTLVLATFTAVSLQQYAAQQFYGIAYAEAKPGAPRMMPRSLITTEAKATAAQPPKTSSPAASPSNQTNTAAAKTPAPATGPASAAPKKTAPAAAAPAPQPTAPVSDIASEAICPGQAGTANAAGVLACMTAYARQQHGLNATASNASLVAAAEAKTQDMVTCGYSHTACGRAFNYWFAPKGYNGRCAAENIAAGQTSIGQVFQAWMNSAGHRANILGTNYRDIGAAYSPSGNLWTMQLGGC